MKKKFTFLIAAIAAILMMAQPRMAVGQVTIDTAAYKKLTFPDDNNANNHVSSYSTTWTAKMGSDSWSISNFNNNSWNNNWTYIKCGNKNAASTGTITSFKVDKPVRSVTIRISAINTSNVNSISLYTSTDSTNWGSAVGTFTMATGLKTVVIPTPTQNLYYKIAASCKKGSSGNGYLTIDSLQYNVQTFTVTYNNNGGSGTMTDSNSPYWIGSTVTTKANTFTAPTGYTFSGWNTAANGSGTSYAAGATFTINANTTLYAQWEASGPAVSIDPTAWDFGEVTVNQTSQKTFSVTHANLSSALSIAVPSGYTVEPNSIVQNASSPTNVTVTFAPTSVSGNYNDNLSITGGGLGSAVTASLSGTGGCITSSALTYTSPVELTLDGDYVEYTLTSTGGGNGGGITYEVTTNPGENGMVEGNVFTAVETGEYVVTATQAANGNYCECVATITINVTGTDPTCEILPAIWEFGKVLTDTYVEKTFTVNTANLEGNLTVGIDHTADGFSVTPTTINQAATSTPVTVRFAPTAATEDLTATLTISGGGLTSNVTALISGQGDAGYTVTFSPGSNGSITPSNTIRVVSGESIASNQLPTASPSEACAEDGWTFYGWAESAVSGTTTSPSLVSFPYTPTGNATLYAVYKITEGNDNNTGNVFSSGSYSNGEITWTSTGVVTIKQEQNTGQTAPNSDYVSEPRWYSGNKITITQTTALDSIIVVANTSGYATALANSTYTNASASVCAWDNTSFTVKITPSNSSNITIVMGGQSRLSSLTAYYSNSTTTYNSNPLCLEKVATPNITLAAGTYTSVQTTTITCETTGATIRYTTDGTEPSTTNGTVYTEAININESMTIKAIAYKDGMANSEIASKDYVINLPLTSMDAVFVKATQIGSSATQDVTVVFNNWVVSAVNGSSAYVTDNAGKGFIIYTSDHGFAVGDKLSGTVSGTPLKLYNGAAEFTNIKKADISSVTGEQTVEVVTKTISELSGVNTGAIITVNNVRYDGSTYLEDPDDSSVKIKPYNGLGYSALFTEDHNYNVTGMYLQFSTTKELCPRSAGDVVEVQYAISLTQPQAGGSISVQGDKTTAKYEEEVTLVATPTGSYVLTGWTVMNGQDEITVENNKFTMPKGAVTVTATFALKYTVTYHANGGTGDDVVQVYDDGDEVTVAAANLFEAPDCHSFSEWNTNADGDGTQYNPGYQFNISANLELYARWAENSSFTVTYNVNGSTTAIAAETVNCGDAVTLPAASLEPLSFLGWATTEGGTVAYKAGASYGPTANVTLYAVFGAMGEDYLTITTTTTGISDAYKDNSAFEINDIDFTCNDICKQGPTDSKYIQMKSTGYIYNDNNNSFGKITSIVITYYDATTSAIVKFGTSYNPTSSDAVSGVANDYVLTYTPDSENDYGYFHVGASETVHMLSIVINYEATAPVTIINISDTPTEPTTSIPANSCIVVHDGGVLTFTGSNNDASKLIVQDGGQLKVTSSAKDGGVKATVQKDIIGYGTGISDKWNFIASPITTNMSPAAVTNLLGEKIDDDPVTYNYDLYRLNNTIWENYHQHNENADPFMLVNGQGYLYAKQTNTTLSFAGTIKPYDDTYEIPVSKGWNLVGNPYTFDAYASVPYYAMDEDGTGITANTVSVATAVKPCTGIVIYAENDGTIAFYDQGSVTSVNHGNLQMVLAHNVTSRDGASINKTLDNAIVSFNEGTKLQKFYFGEPAANIFIPQNGEDYAIAFSNRQGDMPLNFKAKELGTYTISFAGEEMDLNGIYLIDILEQKEIDLSVNPSYTFIGSPADSQARFIIRFDGSENSEVSESSDIFAYQSGNDIIVSGEGELQIFDVMGRLVMTQRVTGVETVRKPSQGGVYIFRLNGKTQKIVVR